MSFSLSPELNSHIELSFRKDIFDSLRKRISDVRHDFSYKSSYSFLSFLTDPEHKESLRKLKEEKDSPKLKKIFVVGIGGANLGSQAILEAFPENKSREFIYLDTIYPGESDDLKQKIETLKNKESFLVIVISKSGATIETLTNAKLVTSLLEKKFGDISSQMIVVTGENSPLRSWAEHNSIKIFTLPNSLSDRFGVFSPIGMVPLVFSGLNLEDFYAGAERALSWNTEPTGQGRALEAGLALDQEVPAGRHSILDLFFFSKKLETFGKWHRQLIAESLGKEKTELSQELDRSLTPTVSVGTTDLHSMLQLYLSQPEERITWFFNVEEEGEREVGVSNLMSEVLPNIDAEKPEHILSAVYESVLEAYDKRKIPYMESKLKKVSEEELGFHMMQAMLLVLGVAHIWNIDPFNQPNVEGYKKRIRELI